jgi:hypothetical protein
MGREPLVCFEQEAGWTLKKILLSLPAMEPQILDLSACCLATAVCQLCYLSCLGVVHIFVVFHVFFLFVKNILLIGNFMFCILCYGGALLFSHCHSAYSKYSLKCPPLMLWN